MPTIDKKTDALLDGLLENARSRYELIVAWDPAKSQPLSFVFLLVNDVILVTDRVQTQSPVVFRRLPEPTGGEYKIAWALTPEVPLRGVVIGLVDTTTGAKIRVDGAKDLERGATWRGDASTKRSRDDSRDRSRFRPLHFPGDFDDRKSVVAPEQGAGAFGASTSVPKAE